LPNSHTLEAALHSGATLEGMSLSRAEYPQEGYSWYDQLPQIVGTAVLVDDIPYEKWSAGKSRPSKIEIEVTIAQAGQPARSIRLPALIHVATDDGALDFVAVHSSPWDNERLDGPFSVLAFLLSATFRASDDFSECDSWQTQRAEYEEDVYRAVNEYFRGPEASLLDEPCGDAVIGARRDQHIVPGEQPPQLCRCFHLGLPIQA